MDGEDIVEARWGTVGAPRWRRGAVILVVGLLAVAFGGCRDEPESPETGDAVEQADESEPDAEAGEGDSIEKERAAYGLPFPPKVRGVSHEEDRVEVTTKMEIVDLADFFRTRLVDYEILEPGEERLRIIGLREFMPSIHVYRYGPISILTYRPAREKPKKPTFQDGTPDDEETAGEESSGGSSTTSSSSGGAGTSLQELAPEAEPGEPYTPPPDSPLHHPRYKENYGKPIGDWQLP